MSEGLRNKQLDGLRGYAALMVVYYHAILGAEPDLIPRVLYRNISTLSGVSDVITKLGLIIFNGSAAVAAFFVMSGAVLFRSLGRETGRPAQILGRFFVGRFFRIYPVLFLCLILCWVAFNFAGLPSSPETLLKNLVLYDFGVNGATWTLSVEAWATVLLALAFLAYRRFGEAGIIAVGFAFAVLYLAPFKGQFVQFKMYIYSFILGTMITTRLGKLVIEKLPVLIWPALLVGALFAKSTIQETLIALLVGMLFYNRAGRLGEWLSRPTASFLGTISYSLYLFNVLFLEIINASVRDIHPLPANPLFVGLVTGSIIVLLTLPVAYCAYHYVELPCIRFGKRVMTWRASPAPRQAESLG